jgi:hypothetical protein
VHRLVEAHVSEKRADSIFRAEVMSWNQMDHIEWQEENSEGKGPVSESLVILNSI